MDFRMLMRCHMRMQENRDNIYRRRECRMEKRIIIEAMSELFRTCEGNVIPAEKALKGCEGLIMFERPIFGVSAANDSIYQIFKRNEVIGDNFMLPEEWLPGARSVISFFLPFTERVRSSNRGDPESTSPEWLHARIEGQAFIDAYTEKLKAYFKSCGTEACNEYNPRYGCGKCQVGVPCEDKIPQKRSG